MRPKNRKYLKIGLIVFVSLLILLLISGLIAYSKRQFLLETAISKAKLKAQSQYNLDVKIGSASFTGLTTVNLKDITIVPFNRDSLLHINHFQVSVKVWPLLIGNVKLSTIIMEDGKLNLTSIKGVRNYEFLFKKQKDSTSKKAGANLADFAHNLMTQFLYKIPDDLNLTNFDIAFRDDSNKLNLQIPKATIERGRLYSTILVNNGYATWHIAGNVNTAKKNVALQLYADGKKVELPFIEKKYGLKLNFDTIGTELKKEEQNGDETQIYSSCFVKNLLINHPKIASNDIVVPSASIDANVFIGENYVSVDSSSVIHLKNISANPFIKITLKPTKIYELKLHTEWLDAQSLFNSFPGGLFESLAGIKVSGKLKYGLKFYLNTKDADNVQFDSWLEKENFKVLQYGQTDLTKLNQVFVYTPYENGKPMPPRIVGPANPNFTPLNQISPNLRNAVMTAEDPSFYRHHGFVEESIRKSIATDFKEKQFKRGGSTISMQLVKNVFLSRQKTLARKIEETLIVWIIENNNISTKNRMLEVYFNIIEWGRNIYGIGEASRYYFGKSPADLTIGESIYLASIVPKPKSGLYSFEPDGSLKPYLHGYFNLIGRLMASKGYTPSDSSAYGFYTVRLREALRPKMAPVDTTAADSLNQDGDEGVGALQHLNFFQRLFGKKDSTVEKAIEKKVDTAGKTPKEIRIEKRELRRREKEKQKELHDRGLM
ncbi:biosynthetic peptidoglycan transglycosylase [Mucilaginibacter arboris]|uniref:Penicillin-binding protein n=1 Tax=Mucilaginibacter arboris TaxID=2682090 RepID=A0A7K1SSH6_9SPHI|nr:biosynthetic peptidoglycan transglycosylase [Mucilaginibacter arboris]MVN20269.1 penicillin-binding protein [Mucilaginibacter arboris]